MGKVIHGEFLQIVDELQILAEKAGARPFGRGAEEGFEYEVDETEERDPQTGEAYGWIVLNLYVKQPGQNLSRRQIRRRSSQGFPEPSDQNRYLYTLDEADLRSTVEQLIR